MRKEKTDGDGRWTDSVLLYTVILKLMDVLPIESIMWLRSGRCACTQRVLPLVGSSNKRFLLSSTLPLHTVTTQAIYMSPDYKVPTHTRTMESQSAMEKLPQHRDLYMGWWDEPLALQSK